MKIKFKKLHENAVLPSYSIEGDAGLDLVAVEKRMLDLKNGSVKYDIGLAVEIPKGYVGLIFPRSSICKTYLTLSNCVGVIDSGYRGQISVVFKYDGYIATMYHLEDKHIKEHTSTEEKMLNNYKPTRYEVGDRVAQLIILPYPAIESEWSEELSDTIRGNGGFGSTGK